MIRGIRLVAASAGVAVSLAAVFPGPGGQSALAASLSDGSFNAQSVDRFIKQRQRPQATPGAATRGSDGRRKDLIMGALGTALAMRTLGSVDAREPIKHLDARETTVYRRLFDPGSDLERRLWTYFWQGALAYPAHMRSEAPIIGFYHPVSDVWLLTRWQHSGGELKLVDLSAVSGDAVRGTGPAQTAPPWTLRRGQALALSLAQSHDATIAAYHQRYSVLSHRRSAMLPPSQLKVAQRRLSLFGYSVTSLMADPGYAEAVNSMRAAIRTGDPDVLRSLATGRTVVPAQWLTSLPDSVRQSLRPVGYLRHGSGSTVMLGSPLNGGLVIMADYRPARAGTVPALTSFLAMNIKKAERLGQ